MRILDSYQLPHAERTGFDADLTEEERGIADVVHRFSRDVVRPLGLQLDNMSAKEVIAKDSPLWNLFSAYQELGFTEEVLASMPPADAARIESIIIEEIGWGDAGLAVSLAVAGFPMRVAYATGRPELIELCEGKIGCWPVTQPDAGSDMIDAYGADRHPGTTGSKGNLLARFDGDDIVISGQTSAWVSNGTIADVAALCCPADFGHGVVDSQGNSNRAVILVPLQDPAVSRGAPLEKLGQLPLPQGEIFFDDLRVPRQYAVSYGEQGAPGFLSVLAEAGVFMSQCFTGLARASFEHALAYTHERRQGGVELAQHQTVRYRLGEMYKKVEASRAMARRAAHHLRCAPRPHATVSSTAKAFVTQAAFEVANEALQLMGGNGLSREYPMEKIVRDARAALIEDGENFFLTMRLGTTLCEMYASGWGRD